MNERRVLVMHAGGGKAGSSALQSALNQAAAKLAKVGINYAEAPAASSAYDIRSGNGISLYEKIAKPEWESRTGELIEGFLGDQAIGICSSEYLASMAAGYWQQLIEAAAQRRIDIKVVYFVRSPVGYVAASYNQDVKRGGECRSLEEAAQTAGWQHFDDLQKLDKLFDDDHLRVLNYDLARKGIIDAFVSAWPELLPAASPLGKLKSVTVNRSLSSAELDVMRLVNSRIGEDLGPEISDRLILDAPELRTRLSVASSTAEILSGKFREATDWINARFFPTASSPLRVSAGVAVGEVEDQDQPERALGIVLDWALSRVGSERADLSFVRRRMLDIDWHNANDPVIPNDFDPIAYLFNNDDILRSDNPPYQHYISNGHAERRPYRWPVRVDVTREESVAGAVARLQLDDPDGWTDTPIWPRLRHFLQLEALLHDFGEREREHVRQIRRLHENLGFEGEQFRQMLDRTVAPLRGAVDAARTSVDSQLDNLQAEISTAQAVQFETVNTNLNRIADGLLANRAEQESLSKLIEKKDEELASARELLRQYRETGLLQHLKWSLFRTDRP
jgi:hypothetical protein